MQSHLLKQLRTLDAQRLTTPFMRPATLYINNNRKSGKPTLRVSVTESYQDIYSKKMRESTGKEKTWNTPFKPSTAQHYATIHPLPGSANHWFDRPAVASSHHWREEILEEITSTPTFTLSQVLPPSLATTPTLWLYLRLRQKRRWGDHASPAQEVCCIIIQNHHKV